MQTQADALAIIRDMLISGPLPHSELTAALDAQGDGWAAAFIVPLLRGGLLAGEGIYDGDGAYVEARVYRPEDLAHA